jgi:phage antirepressor YoqD-like protein
MTPIVEAHRVLTDATGACTISQVAKVLGTGQRKLFARLRADGILMQSNLPYQQYIDDGYFVVRDRTIQIGKTPVLKKQTFVTARWESYLAKRYGGALVPV